MIRNNNGVKNEKFNDCKSFRINEYYASSC